MTVINLPEANSGIITDRIGTRYRQDTKLFVLRKRNGGKGDYDYWTCSSEHGTGWCRNPKQSFSPSELTREIWRLIDNGWFVDCEIVELAVMEKDQ